MKIITTINEIRDVLNDYRKKGKTIGLVPTMGFLHKGHQSLINEAKKQTDVVVVTIFVNPTQFGPNEDFERYPRDLERDILAAKEALADIIFAPTVNEMYPSPLKTTVNVSNEMTGKLCGASRQGHFEGVATIVSKLFLITQPDKAFFGLKDAQQVAVIEQLVVDLNFPTQIIPCPIVREEDGLALSSRNVYLDDNERRQATILFASLKEAKKLILSGEKDAVVIKNQLQKQIKEMPQAKIDYIEILTYPRLEDVREINNQERTIIALAVWFGNTRLIDNLIIQ